MKLTNSQIYYTANAFNEAFADFKGYIPAKANFLLQKNISILTAAAQEIEKARMEIAKHYGVINEKENRYDIAPEHLTIVEQEMTDLLNIEQDLSIKTFSIEALGNIELTPAQMQIIMFMIDEE